MNSSVFALDLISKLVESRCWQDSSVEHKSEDAQVRMSERLRQVSKFILEEESFNCLLHTDVCLLWKTQRE